MVFCSCICVAVGFRVCVWVGGVYVLLVWVMCFIFGLVFCILIRCVVICFLDLFVSA